MLESCRFISINAYSLPRRRARKKRLASCGTSRASWTREILIRGMERGERMNEMIDGYKFTRRRLKALRTLNIDNTERQIIGEMMTDCEYVIQWLQYGRRPGNRRGIERRAAYQREQLIDPIRMQAYVSSNTAGSPANLSEWQRSQLEDALKRLSPRERECYTLAHGECFSFAEIGEMLHITKSSVETYVSRAQKKISENLSSSLILFGG